MRTYKKQFSFISLIIMVMILFSSFSMNKAVKADNTYSDFYFSSGASCKTDGSTIYSLAFTLVLSQEIVSSNTEITITISKGSEHYSLRDANPLDLTKGEKIGTIYKFIISLIGCPECVETEAEVTASFTNNSIVHKAVSDKRSLKYIWSKIKEYDDWASYNFSPYTKSKILMILNGKTNSEGYSFDNSNALEDLKETENFDLLKYPYDMSGIMKSAEIINFVEWCYSFKESATQDFALYIYFYNPENKDIDTESLSNRIQIASAYDSYPIDKDSVPTDYETYTLKYCNKSTGDYNNLFYKFRIIDHESADGLSIRQRVNSLERRYDVSGIVLATTSGTEKEYTVGGRYMFSGYAKGYGPEETAESTLKNTGYTSFETIRLEVDSTTFRTTSSSLGVGHQNDVNSVYFSLPNKYIKDYGNLQKIKAEWYEYKTEDIYVIDNNYTAYETLLPKVGESVGNKGDGTYSFGFGFYPGQSPLPNGFTSAYNYKLKQCTLPAVGIVNNYIDKIYYLFNVSSIDDVLVNSSELKSYINSYNKTNNKGTLSVKNGTISADLFKDNVDTGRTKGYNVKEVDANDKFNILSYDSTKTAWQKFWDYGFTKIDTDDGRNDVEPIYIVNDTDLALSDSNMANKLLISKKDSTAFKQLASTAKTNDSSMVLFRFAQTDYYSQKGIVCKNGKSTKGDVYQATETVFLDFKIIQLTFTKDGNYKAIPVVSNPIDIVSDITKTPGTKTNINWLDALLKKLGAWGVLILSIIIGVIVLVIELSISKGFAKIGNVPIKVILLLIILGVSVAGDYYFVHYAMQLIAGLGGL